jgi:hypothetical protein
MAALISVPFLIFVCLLMLSSSALVECFIRVATTMFWDVVLDVLVISASGFVVLEVAVLFAVTRRRWRQECRRAFVPDSPGNICRLGSERGSPPKFWIEDDKGNRLGSLDFSQRMPNYRMPEFGSVEGSLDFTSWITSFSGVRQDGSRVFDASLAGGAALRQELSAWMHRRYAVTLFDTGFPLPTLVAIFAVLDKLGVD